MSGDYDAIQGASIDQRKLSSRYSPDSTSSKAATLEKTSRSDFPPSARARSRMWRGHAGRKSALFTFFGLLNRGMENYSVAVFNEQTEETN